MRPALPLLAALLSLSSLVGHAQDRPASPIHGFSPARLQAQRDLERRFDAEVSTANLTAWLKQLAGRPHHAGSPHGKANAEFMARLLREWGYQVEIKRYDVLFPTPKTRRLELVAPTSFTARLAEPPLADDALSKLQAEALPTFNMYSIDGDVTGELVYVNYGVPADYEALERRGIDVKGKIVLARYGGSWRGIKPKVAAEHGAIGCLIYSDPRDDGYGQGDVYPKGGYRNEHSAQRGSVSDMPVYPGDPLTPGVAATSDAPRPEFTKAQSLTKIPVLPISYADARPLLEALGGPMAPAAWRGGLPIPYHLGPGPARVHLQLAFDWKLAPAYNVIATLPGGEFPDQWVVRGNHHDGWVAGASDPVSGMVAVLEEARIVGALARTGWKPRRTLVFAAWDAEEPGLLGSTEWVEDLADTLSAKVVAYVNSDSNARGFFDAGGTHSLERFVNEIARDVPDPKVKGSVADRLLARTILQGSAAERRLAREEQRFEIDALGSGSDYTPFLQHLGIASLDIGFGGEGEYGQYHSVYDSVDHYLRFQDPDLSYAAALAKVGGRAVLRLSEADLLPFDFTRAAERISRYVDEVGDLVKAMKAETTEHNRRVDEGAFTLAANPTETWIVPKKKDEVPEVDLEPLRQAVERLRVAARRFDIAAKATGEVPASTLATANAIVFKAERTLTRADGLPRRPWFRHQVYAPGLYTGYGVKTLPAVREALEQRAWDEARAQVPLVAQTLERYAGEIERAASVLAP
ncbi:transferrin receptor-like dimerization domain-containing protein [Luteitalea sp. TBR-22]|uniref:transferrin receptor-like dimerization domain-containing protein n=1 Tax=Luteitalea sp. TBR-22 TaxID=2802971 RepID=UPI001EF48B44|nr:transferrin receptor-like dimerization domain-containing protein [Luteitalea sp. TBR-22]